MSEHAITGPYEDGSYSYRSWRIVRDLCRQVSVKCSCGGGCNWHQRSVPAFVAFPLHELDLTSFRMVARKASFTFIDALTTPCLASHIKPMFGEMSIEAKIDLWEAARERLFREALTQAVREL